MSNNDLQNIHMYLGVIKRNLLKKFYQERNIILAQSNVLWLIWCWFYYFIDTACIMYHACLYLTIVCIFTLRYVSYIVQMFVVLCIWWLFIVCIVWLLYGDYQ